MEFSASISSKRQQQVLDMKRKLNRFLKFLVALSVLPFVGFSAQVPAEETGVVGASDGAVAVNVIVDIDSESRAITLKSEEGREWVFNAGPDVRNFDRFKRGNLVIMEYYSGFAIALEPKGSGLKECISNLEVERAQPGEKPGMKNTGSIYVAAEVTAVDTKHRSVTLKGALGSLIMKVGDDVGLAQIKAGQEVEALYKESFAVLVLPAPEVSGTVEMKSITVAIGVGVQWGDGTLATYDGTTHAFKVGGLTVVDVGIGSVAASEEV